MRWMDSTGRFRICGRLALGAIGASAMLALTPGCSEKLVVSQPLPVGAEFPTAREEFVGIVYSLPKTVIAVTGKPVAASTAKDPNAPPPGAGAAPDGPVAVGPPPGVGDPAGSTPTGQSYSITPVILPDRDARFLLKYSPGHLEDDTVTLETDSNGLLKTSSANSTGRQGEILVALAQTASAIITMGAGSPLGGLTGLGAAPAPPTPPKCQRVATTFALTFELKDLMNPVQLPDCNFISVDWRPTRVPSAASFGVSPSPAVNASCDFSVCYRTLMPVRATIHAPAAAAGGGSFPGPVIATASFVAVDPELTAGLNLQSAPLVTRKHTVSFSSGLLTSAMIDDPSVALAVAKLPLTIITAILSAPASLLSLKVTNVQDAAALATQQKALLDAQTALIKDIAASRAPSLPVAGSGAGH